MFVVKKVFLMVNKLKLISNLKKKREVCYV